MFLLLKTEILNVETNATLHIISSPRLEPITIFHCLIKTGNFYTISLHSFGASLEGLDHLQTLLVELKDIRHTLYLSD